jgi:hypothetical protein
MSRAGFSGYAVSGAKKQTDLFENNGQKLKVKRPNEK